MVVIPLYHTYVSLPLFRGRGIKGEGAVVGVVVIPLYGDHPCHPSVEGNKH